MNKQKKQLLLLIMLLVAAAAAYFGATAYADYRAEQEAEAEQLPKQYVIELEQADITSMTYDHDGGIYTFTKEEDIWVSSEDQSTAIKQDKLEAMAQKISNLEATNTIENVTDLSQYGLAEPEKTITVKAGDVEYTVILGTYNTAVSVYYVYESSDPSTVYTVQTTALTSFNYTLEELIEEEESTESA